MIIDYQIPQNWQIILPLKIDFWQESQQLELYLILITKTEYFDSMYDRVLINIY